MPDEENSSEWGRSIRPYSTRLSPAFAIGICATLIYIKARGAFTRAQCAAVAKVFLKFFDLRKRNHAKVWRKLPNYIRLAIAYTGRLAGSVPRAVASAAGARNALATARGTDPYTRLKSDLNWPGWLGQGEFNAFRRLNGCACLNPLFRLIAPEGKFHLWSYRNAQRMSCAISIS
jgi:hypothetical protein